VRWLAAVPVLALAGLLIIPKPSAITRLPAGVVLLHHEMLVQGEVVGDPKGTALRMAPDFVGRAAIVVRGPASLHDFSIEGNGEIRAELPPWNVPFARFTRGNGILVQGRDVYVSNVAVRHVGGFAILASQARSVHIHDVRVSDSGSRNAAGKNNTTGGILMEEGTTDFEVDGCEFYNILGNAIWTHSLYTSPRNRYGAIRNNRFHTIGRDAIQVGHALDVNVMQNSGWAIGFPAKIVDATPAALDTAGNVERVNYLTNHFEQINGKCIDLDGFHDGAVNGNWCKDVGGYGIVFNNTNPDMQSRNIGIVANVLENVMYGGIFVIGSGHTVANNHLLNLNYSHCDGCGYIPEEPDMLHSGIYLGRKAERPAPARDNIVENNEITGYKMKARCVGHAPGIEADWNTARGNVCSEPRP
jgi:hypothetical protein